MTICTVFHSYNQKNAHKRTYLHSLTKKDKTTTCRLRTVLFIALKKGQNDQGQDPTLCVEQWRLPPPDELRRHFSVFLCSMCSGTHDRWHGSKCFRYRCKCIFLYFMINRTNCARLWRFVNNDNNKALYASMCNAVTIKTLLFQSHSEFCH